MTSSKKNSTLRKLFTIAIAVSLPLVIVQVSLSTTKEKAPATTLNTDLAEDAEEAVTWSEDFDSAMARGLAEGKPVYVAMSIRRHGDESAPNFCRGFHLMDDKLNKKPEITELIKSQTIPVRVDLLDDGLPTGVPALKPWEEMLAANPWPRVGFGHWFMIDPHGDQMLAIQRTILHNHDGLKFAYDLDEELSILRLGVERFETIQKL